MFTKPISLIGMAGCGKTTIGKKLAARYNFIFCDTDILIEKKCTIKHITHICNI